MFTRIKNLWDNYGFEILISLCIAFIVLYGLYRRIAGLKGTWAKDRYKIFDSYIPSDQTHTHNHHHNPRRRSRRGAPKESKGEAECRRVLQELFGKRFGNERPDFLRNPVTGGNFNLELDCFDRELRLAVEYNGVQHYKYIPFFHKNKEAFLNQKYRDDMKRRMCRDNGIVLIEVPNTVKICDIRNYIIKECRNAGYKI